MFDYNNKNIANAPAKYESNEVDASTCVKFCLNVRSANIRRTNNDTRNCTEPQMLHLLHCFWFDDIECGSCASVQHMCEARVQHAEVSSSQIHAL